MFVPQCAKCVGHYCESNEGWKSEDLPEFCPMKYKMNIIKQALNRYSDEQTKQLYINSAITEKQAYQKIRGRVISVRPRILEIISFSRLMKWSKLGIAFCGGLDSEAKRVVEILENSDFEVHSIRCTCGCTDKTILGVPEEHKIVNLIGEPSRFEAGCNPLVQAEVLNSEDLDLHIIVGLCIGHDILFTKHSKAPVTTLIVKDRVTGHNPMASLYSAYHHPVYWREELTLRGKAKG